MGKKRKSAIKSTQNLNHTTEGECFCEFCIHARRRGLAHGEIGDVLIVLPYFEGEFEDNGEGLPVEVYNIKKAIPFYMDRGILVMTDCYPIVEH